MAYLVGALVDVSGSMKRNAGVALDEKGGEWAKSIFQVIDDLIKHDVSSRNKVFALAVGGSCGNGVFDILSTVQQFNDEKFRSVSGQQDTLRRIINNIFEILEQNGAKTIRKWASIDTVCNVLDRDLAHLFLCQLRTSSEFCKFIVDKCLPNACKDWGVVKSDPTGLTTFLQGVCSSTITSFKQASEEDVIAVVEKAKGHLLINKGNIFTVKKASTIVHGVTDESEITDERARELLKSIEPFIYGRTPLYRSLKDAFNIFIHQITSTELSKGLVILSDGEPTDEGNVSQLTQNFKDSGVTVVSCFITKSLDIEPKRLYSSRQRQWEDGANFLFQLSSVVPTQLIPRTIFLKRKWKIDIEDNETKLFLQVNHPDNVHDACDLARNVVCCQDSLAELLVSTSLDIYINQDAGNLLPRQQVGGTCYANASAATLHLAMKRILGRDGGYPDFQTLRDEMIERHGVNGADIICVLHEICQKYRLQCREIEDVNEALRAITEKRPVVATFRLTDKEWECFEQFYRGSPSGILTKKDLDISLRVGNEVLHGHAVVLTSFDSQCLRFMNSWGTEWAESGFFRVRNAEVLNLKFIDVFWKKSNLSSSERSYYDFHGAEVAKDLIRKLKGLQSAVYKCPKCDKSSKVTEFTGTLSEAICPSCKKGFKVEEGNILALNVYLTSISH